LKNRGAARDRGRNRHEGHDFLLAAPGQSRQETADRLDAILRVAGDANYRLLNFGNLGGATGGGGSRCRITHEIARLNVLIKLSTTVAKDKQRQVPRDLPRCRLALGSGVSNDY